LLVKSPPFMLNAIFPEILDLISQFVISMERKYVLRKWFRWVYIYTTV
jgi:hypothetical protein